MASVRYWGYNIVFGVGMLTLAYFNSALLARLLLTVLACFAFFQAGVIAEVSKGDTAPLHDNARLWLWVNASGTVLYSYLFLTSSPLFGAVINSVLLSTTAWLWGAVWQQVQRERTIVRSCPPGRDAGA